MSAPDGQASRDSGVPGAARGAQTEMQAALTSAASGGARGLFAKYRQIFLGRAPLVLYELAATAAQNAGGALGFWLRKQLYPRLLGRCGRGVVFGKGVVLRHPGRIWIGDGAVIDDGVVLDAKGPDGPDPNIVLGDGVFLGRNTILSCKGGRIELGDNANLGANCQIQSESDCRVGANVLFASYCYVVAGGNHGMERVDLPPIQQEPVSRGGVRICDGAWLGANVKVIDGVEMGRESIAAAGAVLVRSCQGWDIVGGVPAKRIRNRLEEARAAGRPPPADADPHRLTPPTRREAPDAAAAGAAGTPPRKSLPRRVLGTLLKVALSAGLIWYLVSLQSGAARKAYRSIEPGGSTRQSLEAEPPQGKAALRLIRDETRSGPAEGVYGVGDLSGPLIAVRFAPDGTVEAKSWARGFWASVWAQMRNYRRNWPWFLFLGLFNFAGYLITSWNWRQSLLVQGKLARFWPMVGSNVIAGLFNNILPTNIGGDVVRVRDSAIGVFGAEGRSDYMRSGTVVVVQRVVGLFALVLIALVAAAARSGEVFAEKQAASWLVALAVAAPLVAAVAYALLHPRVLAGLDGLLGAFRGLPLVGKLAAKFMVVLETAGRYRQQRVLLLRIFLTSILLQVNVVAYYYFFTYVVGCERTFLQVFSAAPVVVILMTVVPSINGVGVRDWGFKALLGLPSSVAIAFALVDVIWRVAWGIFGGLLLMVRGAVRPGAWVVRETDAPAAGADAGKA